MLSVYPLVGLADQIGEVQLAIHNRRHLHRREHYESMALAARH
jgi:hypothetical protein